jgi:hypothetical protein
VTFKLRNLQQTEDEAGDWLSFACSNEHTRLINHSTLYPAIEHFQLILLKIIDRKDEALQCRSSFFFGRSSGTYFFIPEILLDTIMMCIVCASCHITCQDTTRNLLQIEI